MNIYRKYKNHDVIWNFLEKASIICRTCVHQKILLQGKHPISYVIIKTLLQKLTTEFRLKKIPTDDQIEHIVDYMKACGIQRSQMAGVND